MITKRDFNGAVLYTICKGSIEASVTDLGATLVSLRVNGRETVLGYGGAEEYRRGTDYLGATVGRFANRIAGAVFSLNGVEYRLPENEGRNQLHGGPNSYDKRLWTAEELPDGLRFTLVSPEGDNGFPGTLTAVVSYRLLENGLRIDFEGRSDKDTIYAPTNHSYFDLGAGDALRHELWLNTDTVLDVDEELIPTREVPVTEKFDLRQLREVGEDLDHCFPLKGEHACTLRAPGLRMELYTDFPAVQIYTGSGLHAPFGKNAGIAIEPEFYPDGPNRPDFPSVTLKAGERFHRWAEYRFFNEK